MHTHGTLLGTPSTTSVPPSRLGTLLLADGTAFRGYGLGHTQLTSGELVFSTSMTGYVEALTDPSYRGQLLMFTFPLVGNYGVDREHAQSAEIQAQGAIMSTLSESWVQRRSLREFLNGHDVPALHGVDTRAIARHIRCHGSMPAALSIHRPGEEPSRAEFREALERFRYDSVDYVTGASVSAPQWHGDGRRLIALLDCGGKRGMIDELMRRDSRVVVLPAGTPAPAILDFAPAGVVISNGPGNPEAAAPVIETVRRLWGRVPLFGICLGHQVLALAAGGSTYKLKFGHRGANHPVQDVQTGRAFVTTQNHGFAVDAASLPGDLVVSHRNLNDGTVEGLRHQRLPIRSVQFHPEGAPGPRDAGVMLDEWLEQVA